MNKFIQKITTLIKEKRLKLQKKIIENRLKDEKEKEALEILKKKEKEIEFSRYPESMRNPNIPRRISPVNLFEIEFPIDVRIKELRKQVLYWEERTWKNANIQEEFNVEKNMLDELETKELINIFEFKNPEDLACLKRTENFVTASYVYKAMVDSI